VWGVRGRRGPFPGEGGNEAKKSTATSGTTLGRKYIKKGGPEERNVKRPRPEI